MTRLRPLFATRTRRLLAGVLGALIVAGIAVGVAVSPGPAAAVRSLVQRIEVPSGPGVSGPVVLDTTMYLPARTPAPAILVAHGFGGSKDSVAPDAERLARAGFVVLAYSARGFGASSGQIGLDSLNYEVPDARALVSWLAGRPEVQLDKPGDPRIGVTGGSYGGALSLLLAGTDPRIDAVVPVITWNDLSGALFPNSAAASPTPSGSPAAMASEPDGVFKKAWAASLIASVTTDTDLTASAGTAPTDNGDSGFGRGSRSSSSASTVASSGAALAGDPPGPNQADASIGCGRLMAAVCSAYVQAAQSGRITPQFRTLLAQSSPKTVASHIKAPTLLVQGEKDTLFGLDQADANARQIAATGTTVAVTWYDGGHSGATEPDSVTENRITGWFQHYLMRSGAVPDNGFVYSVEGPLSDTGQARTRTLRAPTYPGLVTGSADRATVALSGTPQVVLNPPGGSPAAITSLPGLSGLAGTALAGLAGGLPGQTATFAAAAAGSPLVITGTPTVTITIASLPAGSTSGAASGAVLFASLSKVTATGVRTVAGNAVAPIRLANLPVDGTPKTVTVDLPAVAFQIEAGSYLEVRFATTDQGFAGPAAPAAYRISLAGNGVSLPMVAGTRISAGEVPVGTLIALICLAALLGLALVFGGHTRRRRLGKPPGVSTGPSGPTASRGAEVFPLRITSLAKRYPGGVAAVQDVSFQVRPGEVLGLLGPNGAGKTTTLRMVMGLITPTAGDIVVFGEKVVPGAPILSRIGSFVEGSGFLPHLSGRANLELYWRATGRPFNDAHLAEVLEIAGLGTAIRRRVKTYSQGMRQRLAIAQAMLGLPDLLLLDEPTNGLDPPQIHAMREVLRRYAATGRTVLISSHLLSEVEQTCTHVVVVHLGRTIAAGTVAELVSGSGELLFTVDDAERAARVLRQMSDVRFVAVESLPGEPGAVRAEVGSSAAVAVAALVAAGVAVSGVAPKNRLEDVFLALIGGGS